MNYNPRPPPRFRKTETSIVFYLFVLHSVTCLKTCHFTACFNVTMNIYVNTAHDVFEVLIIFAKYILLYLHIFTCTYRGTHTQAHMYNQHTRGMATTRHRSLVETGGRKAFFRDKGLAHAQGKGKKRKRYVRKTRYSRILKKKDSSTQSFQQS